MKIPVVASAAVCAFFAGSLAAHHSFSAEYDAWAFSGGAPGQLMRRGIYKTALPIGSTVNVEGFRAKDGSNNANGNKVTFPDGRMVFTAGQEPGEKGGEK